MDVNTRKQQTSTKEMLSVKNNSSNSIHNALPHQQVCSTTVVTKQQMFTKQIRKCYVAKKAGEQSIAPLLETISALAVNSDFSDDENYQEYQSNVGLHEDDEDGVEDYDFEQNLNEEQKFCSETTSQSLNTDQRDNVEPPLDDLQGSFQDGANSAFPRTLQHSDMRPVNAYVVSEPFCSPISRVSSSVVSRPRFDLSENENSNNCSSQNEINDAQHCSIVNNNLGKCVRFNADVQVTSVSPRLTHKTPLIAGSNPTNSQNHASFYRHDSTEYNPSFETMVFNDSNDHHSQHSSELGSNMYDEVASTTNSQPLGNVKAANEHDLPESNLLGNRVIRDLSTAELQCKFKKKHCGHEHELLMQPLYSNIDQMLNEHKTDPKVANCSNSALSQKSILKDPLCAKLRSAIRKGQFATHDLTQIESEIDSLFYGSDLPKKSDSNNVDTASHNDVVNNEKKSTCDVLASNLFAKLESDKIEPKIEKSIQNKSFFDAFKTSLKKCSIDENRISDKLKAAPCSSYIKMIEEKYRNKEAENSLFANNNKYKSGKNLNKVKGNSKQTDPELKSKSKLFKTNIHSKMQNLNVENNHFTTLLSSFQSSHQLGQLNSNMPMFSSTMDQLMNNIIDETSRSVEKTENNQKQSESQNKTNVKQNKTTPKKPNRIAAIPLRKNTICRNNLYSFFADPVKGPSINNLMDELSRNFNSFSDNESVKSSTSTLSKSLVENHIYEEILYECFEKQNQIDSLITDVTDQLEPTKNLTTNSKIRSNELNVTSFMSSLAKANNTTLDSALGFSHKI